MSTVDAVSLLAQIEGSTTLAFAETELRSHGLTLDVQAGSPGAVVPFLRGLAGPEGSGSLAPASAAATG